MEQNGNPPTYKAPSKQLFFLNLAGYLIVMAILWTYYYNVNTRLQGDAYPWEAWFTGGWFIFLMGHFCHTYFDHNKDNCDKQYVKYLQEKDN